ncbi:MAG: hypothetical protein KME25_16025 [Symplocastrum torsivum CPER-KK1]|jgi:hypothetical protein|uniref:Uncharacterized protein n=1 Tax=Symplocastrum torsivum CPER-KK1 TaxID=450513 RepID=A0A951PL27_9CYAN|nr:hypothetical protein [Symplocastrum torsivum CPER-KK1]
MSEPQIHDLGMTDTEYATLAAKGYEPLLELQIIAIGEAPSQARKLTKVVGLLKDKPPKTDEEWSEFMTAWEDACQERPLEA